MKGRPIILLAALAAAAPALMVWPARGAAKDAKSQRPVGAIMLEMMEAKDAAKEKLAVELAATGDPRAKRVLFNYLTGGDSKSAETIDAVASGLAKMGREGLYDAAEELMGPTALAAPGAGGRKLAAVRLYGASRDPRAVAKLTDVIADKRERPDVLMAAVESLAACAGADAVATLRPLRGNPNEKVRKAAVFELMRLGDEESVPFVITVYAALAAEAENAPKAYASARALAAKKDPKAPSKKDLAALERNVGDSRAGFEAFDRKLEVFFAGASPRAVAGVVRAALAKPKDEAAAAVLKRYLAVMTRPETSAEAAALVRHPDSRTRDLALAEVSKHRTPEADAEVARAVAALVASEDIDDRAWGLDHANYLPKDKAKALCLEALKDPNRAVKLAGIRGLERLADPAVVPELEKALGATRDLAVETALRRAIRASLGGLENL